MKSSWMTVCALAVAVVGLLSAILLFRSDIGLALLAITVTVAAIAILLAAGSILDELAQIHKGMVAFNSEDSREFVAAVDSSYEKRQPHEPLATALISESARSFAAKSAPAESASEPAAHSKNAPLSILSAPSVNKTAMMSPQPESYPVEAKQPESISNPAPIKKGDNYKPLAGLSLSSPSPSPSASTSPRPPAPVHQQAPANLINNFAPSSNFDNDPNATTPPSRLPEPTPQRAAVVEAAPVDEMETTQSYLPASLQGNRSAKLNNQTHEPEPELSTESTIGFEVPTTQNAENPPSYREPVRQPSEPPKGKSKLRKRYSTFAGLSLNDTGTMNRNTSDHLDERMPAPAVPMPSLKPPPPPPPPMSKTKERKRYSTFAGLSLNDRSENSMSLPERPQPTAPPASAPVRSASPSQQFSATNLSFSKATDGLGIEASALTDNSNGGNKSDDRFSGISPRAVSAPPLNPQSQPVQPAAAASSTKGSRKRYQTFMGLSLSKTPQPMKRIEPLPSDQTAPLPLSTNAPATSGARNVEAPTPAINKGQLGNLVDGFCSLCGSPQAAGNEYSGVQSEPEFCWYCGAKLRIQ